MTRGRFLAALVAVVCALGPAPAMAQRSGGGGESTGSAVPRGGDSGGGSSPAATPSAPSPGPSSMPSGPAHEQSAPPPSRMSTPSADEGGQSRRRGGESSGGGARAVPRGSGGGDRSAGATGRNAGGSGGSTAAETSSGDEHGIAVGRSRDGRPVTGVAVDRRPGLPVRQGGTIVSYYPSGRYFWPGWGFGLSYFYDPFWYDPYYYGYGYGAPGVYDPYGSYGGGSGTYGRQAYGQNPTGSLRLKVKPSDAEVFVDGFYAGTVDDFNGAFQRLTIEAGTRRIEIRAPGYKTAELDLLIEAGKTLTYGGELER